MRILLILTFILLQTTMNAQENELGQHIDSLLQFSASPSFNGVVLVTQNGKTMYKKSMGFANMDKKTPLTENSQFVIGSISKQFTAVIILREFDKGRVELHAPISTYLRPASRAAGLVRW